MTCHNVTPLHVTSSHRDLSHFHVRCGVFSETKQKRARGEAEARVPSPSPRAIFFGGEIFEIWKFEIFVKYFCSISGHATLQMRRYSRSAAHNYGGYHHHYILNVSNNATVFVASLFDTVTAKSSYGILTSFLHILLVGMLRDCSIPTRRMSHDQNYVPPFSEGGQ